MEEEIETRNMKEEIEPIMILKFSDRADIDTYKTKFCEFIGRFPELNIKAENNIINVFKDASTSISIKKEEELEKPDTVSTKLASKKSHKRKKHQKDPVFFLDTKPTGDEKFSPISIGKVRKLGIEEEEPAKLSFGPTCFNCEGDHSIRDCSMPRDAAKISANKQHHQQKNKTVRYHLEEDLKYGHIRAGKISDNLRNALGLGKFEIPAYIYKMRLIGYPPGWFEAAKLTSSELLMYDGDGNSIKSQNAKKATGLDPEKIIRYPGFNAPLENGFKDQFRHHGVPKYSDAQFPKQLEQYIKFIQSQIDDLETENMDIDETSNAGSDDVIPILDSQEDEEIEAISLQELEKHKNSILEEIKNSQEAEQSDEKTETLNEAETIDDEEITVVEREESIDKIEIDNLERDDSNIKEAKNDTDTIELADLSTTYTDAEDDSTLSNSSLNIIVGTPKATITGTPIFKKTLSPYVRVPPLEQFREGVSQVINFENLPNTEGKYEAMRGVLQIVRKLKEPELQS